MAGLFKLVEADLKGWLRGAKVAELDVQPQFQAHGAFVMRKDGSSDGYDRLVEDIAQELRRDGMQEIVIGVKAILY